MWGLGGAKNRKCWKTNGFTITSWGVKRAMRTPRPPASERQIEFLGVVEVQIIRFLIKNALWLYAELCLLFERGIHFRKKYKTVVEKWKMMPEELRWQVWWVYEGAWWGRKAEMLKKYWFYYYFLKGQRGHKDANRTNTPTSRTICHWKCFIFIRISSCRSCSGEHMFIKIARKVVGK